MLIAPVQLHDPGMRHEKATVDAPQVERLSVSTHSNLYVPVQPHVQRIQGNTPDSILVVQPPPKTCLWSRIKGVFSRHTAPIKAFSRFHPYVRR